MLEHNTPAIDLYRKAGFQVSRAFDCFRSDKATLPDAAADAYAIDDDLAHYHTLDDRAMMTFTPS